MSRTLKVQLTNAGPDLVHEFRNFGEDVWKALDNDCAVSIDEIDASTSDFFLREVPKSELRTVAVRVRELAGRYLTLAISVDEIREGERG